MTNKMFAIRNLYSVIAKIYAEFLAALIIPNIALITS